MKIEIIFEPKKPIKRRYLLPEYLKVIPENMDLWEVQLSAVAKKKITKMVLLYQKNQISGIFICMRNAKKWSDNDWFDFRAMVCEKLAQERFPGEEPELNIMREGGIGPWGCAYFRFPDDVRIVMGMVNVYVDRYHA